MKYIIENSTLSPVIKVASQIKKPASKIVLTLGAKDEGDKVLCSLRITTDAEQGIYNFLAKKPEDWDGTAIVTSIDAANMCSVVESVLSFNEDVYIELSGTILEIGILGKVKTSLPIESQIPEEIKPLKFFYRFEIAGRELLSLLNKGCAFCNEVVDTRGLHNAVLKLLPQTDEIKAYSTDSHIVGSTKVKASFTKSATDDKKQALIDAMDAAITDYCNSHPEQDKDCFNVIIPREAVMHLARFVADDMKVTVLVDARFMHVIIGRFVYSIKQAGTTIVSFDKFYQSFMSEQNAKVCTDVQALRNAISFINKNNAISGQDNIPIKISIKEGEVLIAKSGIEDKIESSIKTSEIKGEQFVSFDGKKVEAALSSLNKGNVVLYAGENHIAFFNGTIEEPDLNSFVFILQVRIQRLDETKDEENETVEESAE